MWIVELEDGVWLAAGLGDPGRTLRVKNARRYTSEKGAAVALGMARKWRPFARARVVEARRKHEIKN